jgi:hypothetical protein
MSDSTEKRCDLRNPCDVLIEWAYFNKPETYGARLLNVSGSGGYFECTTPIIPGATLLIRLHSPTVVEAAEPGHLHFRTTGLGEVKWCRELAAGGPPRFGVGIRYHLPV